MMLNFVRDHWKKFPFSTLVQLIYLIEHQNVFVFIDIELRIKKQYELLFVEQKCCLQLHLKVKVRTQNNQIKDKRVKIQEQLKGTLTLFLTHSIIL